MILEFRDRKKSKLLSFLENNNNFLFKNMSRRPGAVFRTRIFKIYTKNSILGDQKLDSMQNFMIFLIDSAKIQFWRNRDATAPGGNGGSAPNIGVHGATGTFGGALVNQCSAAISLP